MKIERNALLESIRVLNRKNPLKEDVEKDLGNTKVEITATLDPADAARVKEHEEALEAHDKRIEDAYKGKEVKELIEETSSEESRYAHFDVVDRKELAKRINEAKEKGLEFKISRSPKEGYRYDFKVLKEEFVKKDVGDPEVNKNAFNKATEIGSPVAEGFDDNQCVILRASRDNYSAKECIPNTFTVQELCDYLLDNFYPDFPVVLSFDRGYTYGCVNGSSFDSMELEGEDYLEEKIEEPVEEELKVYTSTLEGFEPSAGSRDLWEEIKEKGKVGDLEYQLEVLYPEGISDVALDDLLKNEADWIRDLVDLGDATPEEEIPTDELEDEQIDPVDFSEDEEIDIEPEPSELEAEEESEGEKEREEPAEDDIDEIEPIDIEEPQEEKKEKKPEIKEAVEIPEEKEAEPEDGEGTQLSKLAEGFVASQFKPAGGESTEDIESKVSEAVEASADTDEIVVVDDTEINEMLGMPKADK